LATGREVPRGTSGEKAARAYLRHLTRGCNLHLDRAYSPTHFWVQEGRDGEVLLGLDGQTLRILFPLEDVVLPRPGVWLTRGETMGWILRGHLALPLRAPLSGEAMETNGPLLDQLRRRGVPDAEPGWLMRLFPHEAWEQVPDLLQGEAMLFWAQAKLGILRKSLLEAMALGAEAGPTLNDGGEWNPNLEEVLGPSAFRRLVDQLFREGA